MPLLPRSVPQLWVFCSVLVQLLSRSEEPMKQPERRKNSADHFYLIGYKVWGSQTDFQWPPPKVWIWKKMFKNSMQKRKDVSLNTQSKTIIMLVTISISCPDRRIFAMHGKQEAQDCRGMWHKDWLWLFFPNKYLAYVIKTI